MTNKRFIYNLQTMANYTPSHAIEAAADIRAIQFGYPHSIPTKAERLAALIKK